LQEEVFPFAPQSRSRWRGDTRTCPLPPELDRALQHGAAIGGTRPKALIGDTAREYIAMRSAGRVGLNVAPVKLERALGKDVLLMKRCDRFPVEGGWTRRGHVSALTMLGLDESEARYASYQDLAELIRHRRKSGRRLQLWS
jgi:serine/threonine-protein kinase HipA